MTDDIDKQLDEILKRYGLAQYYGDQVKEYIKILINSEVNKARVSELYDVYGILTGDGDIECWTEINGIQLRIPERINQLIEGE